MLCALLKSWSSQTNGSETQTDTVAHSLLESVPNENLEALVAESRLSSDLYTRQPIAILDDIISSYQFDIDDEKAVDCY